MTLIINSVFGSPSSAVHDCAGPALAQRVGARPPICEARHPPTWMRLSENLPLLATTQSMKFEFKRKCLVLLVCGVLFAPAAAAQSSEDPVETARIQFGPLGLTPTVALTNLGVDTNVFYTVDDPKKDFTLTLSPGLDSWFRAGRTRLHTRARVDFVYFHTYSSERSIDGALDLRYEARLNRLVPYVEASGRSGRQRLGYEIDLRSRRSDRTLRVGLDARIAGKTTIGVFGKRARVEYDSDAQFFGTYLSEVLNREAESVGVSYKQALTPLTTVVVEASDIRERFTHSSTRNSDSARVDVGFDLASSALISGTGRIGYRKLDGVGGAVPEYRGVVAVVDAGYVLLAATRFTVRFDRDIEYSYEADYPYYLRTGVSATITRHLSETWDIQGTAGRQHLGYRLQTDRLSPSAILDRADRVDTVGGGVGYHFGRNVRFGINLDHYTRRSPLTLRHYEGFRFGTSVTYGQ